MIRLCIDTSIGTSVAVTDDSVMRSEVNEFDTMRHAEVIGSLISAALTAAGVTHRDVAAVIAGVGPGPFTGLRVGLAAATAFAVGAGVPLNGIVSHDAIAMELGEDMMRDEVKFLVTTDARRRELAWSRYAIRDAEASPSRRFVRLEGPALARLDEPLFAYLPRCDASAVSAARLGLIASAMVRDGLELPPCEPLYLRSPDVTLSAGPKRVSS